MTQPTDPSGSPKTPSKGGKVNPVWWVPSTYFAEGFPYTVVNTLAEVLWKEAGASLGAIGLTSLFHLPWNIKFLWGPFLDRFETKRRWLLGIEIGLTLILLALAVVAPLPFVLPAAAVLFTILAFFSATHDIAIDGYYLEALDKDEQSAWVGLRAAAYRVAMFVVSGPIVFVVGEYGWVPAFLLTAGIMGGLTLFHSRLLPKVEPRKEPISKLLQAAKTPKVLVRISALAGFIYLGRRFFQSTVWAEAWGGISELWPLLNKISTSGWIGITLLICLIILLIALVPIKRALSTGDGFYVAAFVNFLEQPQVGMILAFIILFRTGESFLLKMKYAFLRDIGLTVAEYGFLSGTVGLLASIAATMIGGWLIGKYGLKRMIWPFVLAQNTLNLLFMALSWSHQSSLAAGGEGVSIYAMGGVITLEAIGSGLGTAVFMVYIMRCCRPSFKAAHMAILTALMSLSFTIAGVMSGFLAESLGFTIYFLITFLATLPGMALIFMVPYLDGTSAADLDKEPAPSV